MHKEHLAQDENSNPREGPARRKERLSPCEHDMNQLNRARAKSGSWDSNGFGPDPEIESVNNRAEDSVPLSPSNSLNLRHLRGCEKEPAGRPHQRPSYHPNYYPSHHYHHRPFYNGYHRKGYWDYESQYRDGKRKEWVPRPGGGRPQRSRTTREAFNSTEGSCAYVRPEQNGGEKGKTVQGGVAGQPPAPAKEEQAGGSWLLFKPLPVFPVDSSSARTLPKISYASKVKENLDGKGLVPSSALRTSNSLPNCLLNTAAEQPDGACPANSTGSLSSSSCSSLSSAPPSPVSQENLGAIFQNEWGLSFINEPGAGQALAEENKPHEGGDDEGGGGDPAVLAVGRLSVHGFYVERTEDGEDQLENPRDWEEMVTYSSQEWNRVWNLYKKDPSRVVLYAESMDGKG
uniref:Uncharacterized protein n=1 Tax=Leptobrachium leishanense TaxID=445787 RepID=A0A8C5Q7E1_9ANUR